MIVIIKSEDLHFLVFSLAALFVSAGAFLSLHTDSVSKAGIVRAYYGAVEAEKRLALAEHRVKNLDFFLNYATALAEADHD